VLSDSQTGLELTGRIVFQMLYEGLNERLEELESYWESMDRDFAELTRSPVREVVLEGVPATSFYDGIHPSFLEAPIEAYPNVSVTAYDSRDSAEQFDQVDVFENRVFVEAWAKSDPGSQDGSDDVVMETVVYRRCQRLGEAIVLVLRDDTTLRGNFQPMKRPPRLRLANPSARRVSKGAGERFMTQLARVDFTIDKNAQ
jgi:hypothetical protein